MSDERFELEDVQRLAATLDTVELGEKDRALLHAIFALAGQATGATGDPDDEVSGFAALAGGLFGSFVTPPTAGAINMDSFQWGVSQSTTGSSGSGQPTGKNPHAPIQL